MFRMRVIIFSTSLALAALLVHSQSQAQGPGGGGRGGFGGGWGGRGRIGPGRADSPLRLLSRPAVQEELKLTDSQKEKIAALSDKADQMRQQIFPRRNRGNNGNGNDNGNGNNGNGNGGNANNAGGGNNANNADQTGNGQGNRRRGGGPGGGGFTRGGGGPGGGGPGGGGFARGGGGPGGGGFNGGGFNPGGYNGGGFNPGGFNGGGFNPGGFNGGGPGGRGGPGGNNGPGGGNRPDFAAMRAASQQLDADVEKELAKILTRPQRERIVQIQLQQQGPLAVATPEIQKKLNMRPEQIEQVIMILNTANQTSSDNRRAMFSMFRSPDGQPLDRAAVQAKMEDPQFRAQMEKNREEARKKQGTLEEQTIARIGKILTKNQKGTFNRLLGPPFDLAKLDRNYDPNAPANASAKPSTDASSKTAAPSTRPTTSPSTATKSSSTAKSTTPNKSTTKSTTTTPKKKGITRSTGR